MRVRDNVGSIQELDMRQRAYRASAAVCAQDVCAKHRLMQATLRLRDRIPPDRGFQGCLWSLWHTAECFVWRQHVRVTFVIHHIQGKDRQILSATDPLEPHQRQPLLLR